MKYGLSANIDEIGSCFDRLLNEKKIGSDPIYVRIDFISDEESIHVSRDNGMGPVLNNQELSALEKTLGQEARIIIHRQGSNATMLFSLPYCFKDHCVGLIVTWVDLNTIYRNLIQIVDASSKRLFLLEYGGQYIPLLMEASSAIDLTALPALANIPEGLPHDFDAVDSTGSKIDMVALRVSIDSSPLSIVSITPQSELFVQKTQWRYFLFLGFLSLFVLVGIVLLLRVKDQNLILSVRLDEATKQQAAITQKNLELEKEIAEREEMERALRASENKYRTLHQNMRDGFMSMGLDGNIVECNSAFCEMLHYQYKEAEIGYLSPERITPQEWRELESRIISEQVLPRGYSEIYEKEFLRKDGSTFPAELRTYSLKDEGGSLVGTWAIVRDIKKFHGTGLGLTLTKEFVELHGGCIWVESEGEGKGATFRFAIPFSPPTQAAIPN